MSIVLIGTALFDLGKKQEAIYDFTKVIYIHPQTYGGYLFRGFYISIIFTSICITCYR